MRGSGLNLTLASDARKYIDNFEVAGMKPTYVKTNSGRTIYFATMTDEEAIAVANMLFDIEMEAVEKLKKEGGLQ